MFTIRTCRLLQASSCIRFSYSSCSHVVFQTSSKTHKGLWDVGEIRRALSACSRYYSFSCNNTVLSECKSRTLPSSSMFCWSYATSRSMSGIGSYLKQHSGGEIHLEKNPETGIAKIKLDYPLKKNAFSGYMMWQLAETVDELSRWEEGKCVIMYGAQQSFCSGGDLETVKKIATPEDGAKLSRFMHDTLTKYYNLPMLTVALVQGKALGGGAEVVTAHDVKVFTHEAKIGFVQSKLSITVGWGGGTRLVQCVGWRRALDLLSSGRLVPGPEALEIGLADTVIPESLDEEDCLRETEAWLQQHYTSQSAGAVRAAKSVVAGARSLDMTDALAREREVFISVWGSPVHRDALLRGEKHR